MSACKNFLGHRKLTYKYSWAAELCQNVVEGDFSLGPAQPAEHQRQIPVAEVVVRFQVDVPHHVLNGDPALAVNVHLGQALLDFLSGEFVL